MIIIWDTWLIVLIGDSPVRMHTPSAIIQYNMAAENPSNSSSIRQPYHIILAGAHDAGKSTIFNTLVTEFEESFKFKADDKRSRQGVQFESFRHKYMDKGEMKVRHR